MAFSVAARVKVNNQQSQWRGKLGTVISVSGNNHQVRLDGYPETGQTVLLVTADMQTTTQPNPVDY